MQSQKKFKRDPVPRISAQEFAVPWSNNVGDINRAIKTADRYEVLALDTASNREGLDKKYSIQTSRFWNNVKFILLKHKKTLKEGKRNESRSAPLPAK